MLECLMGGHCLERQRKPHEGWVCEDVGEIALAVRADLVALP